MVTDSNALHDAGVSRAQQADIAVHAALAGARGMYSLRIAGLSDDLYGGYDLEDLLCLHLGLHCASLQADAQWSCTVTASCKLLHNCTPLEMS